MLYDYNEIEHRTVLTLSTEESKNQRLTLSLLYKNMTIAKSKNVTIFAPYGENSSNLKDDMSKIGYKFVSSNFVGEALMDTEYHFTKK